MAAQARDSPHCSRQARHPLGGTKLVPIAAPFRLTPRPIAADLFSIESGYDRDDESEGDVEAEGGVDQDTEGGEEDGSSGEEWSDVAAVGPLGEMPSVELSVVLCDDATIARLNEEWRGKTGPTDVLSFALMEGEDVGLPYVALGDVVVSLDTAELQARERGLGLRDEVRVLLTHGLLHLVGFDHETDAERDEVRLRLGLCVCVIETVTVILTGGAERDAEATRGEERRSHGECRAVSGADCCRTVTFDTCADDGSRARADAETRVEGDGADCQRVQVTAESRSQSRLTYRVAFASSAPHRKVNVSQARVSATISCSDNSLDLHGGNVRTGRRANGSPGVSESGVASSAVHGAGGAGSLASGVATSGAVVLPKLMRGDRVRAIALDMDGTLLDSASRVRDATAEAIRAAVGKGVLVMLATGG